MDGNVAPLGRICELANKYNAMVMVDESHSAGVAGETGHGVTELYNLRGKIEIITGTARKGIRWSHRRIHHFGKKEIIETAAPAFQALSFLQLHPSFVAAAGLKMIEMMTETNELQDKPSQHQVFHGEDA